MTKENRSSGEEIELPRFINHAAACDFLESIEDPVVKQMISNAYRTLCVSEAWPETDFDLLYFFRIMEEFLRDRTAVANELLGRAGGVDPLSD